MRQICYSTWDTKGSVICYKDSSLPLESCFCPNLGDESFLRSVLGQISWDRQNWYKSFFVFFSRLRQQRICLKCRRPRFDLWVGKISWRREWLFTPVFLPGEVLWQRSLAGYSPWGSKELDVAVTNTFIFYNTVFSKIVYLVK